MKLQEFFLIAFVAAIAVIALALDDDPALEGVALLQQPPKVSQAQWFPVTETLSPNETVVSALEAPLAAAPAIEAAREVEAVNAPRRTAVVQRSEPARSRLYVQARAPRGDRRLHLAATHAITRTPNVSGRIAVHASDSIVRLSGWTSTAGQSLRIEKAVGRVPGVRGVVNAIRPRVGATTS